MSVWYWFNDINRADLSHCHNVYQKSFMDLLRMEPEPPRRQGDYRQRQDTAFQKLRLK